MGWNPNIRTVDGEVHRRFLSLAYGYARQNSGDPDTHVGAIIVETNPELPLEQRVLLQGANRFPPGLKPTPAQLADRAWIEENIIHAERDAIYLAARYGVGTEGKTMYMPWVPCTQCALAIIDSGIGKLVMHKSLVVKTPEKWRKSTSNALELLERCGVETLAYDGAIGGVLHRFYGREWEP